MAPTANSFITTQSYGTPSRQTFVNADGTTIKDLVTAGADGSNVTLFRIASTDTSARNLQLYYNDGTNDIPIAFIPVPVGAGTSATNAIVNGLSSIFHLCLVDANGNAYIPVKAGHKLRGAMAVAVTATFTVTTFCFIENY